MGKGLFLTILFLFLHVAFAFTKDAADPAGEWVGTIKRANDEIPVQLNLNRTVDGLTGSVDIPTARMFGIPVQVVKQDADQFFFRGGEGPAMHEFEGRFSNGVLSGSYRQSERSGTFKMVQLYPVDRHLQKAFYGAYQLTPERFIYIRTWDELGEDQLTYLDESGRVGALYATSADTFFAGEGMRMAFPMHARIRFSGRGNAMRIHWNEEGGRELVGTRIASIREEEISFQNGDVRLAGSLVTPSAKGSYPAVVLVHGSGPVTRDFFGPVAYHFARHGIAVLSYDKRGIAGSGGHWMEASFSDMADDALAAVHLLKTRPEIQASKIGLLGISQGGWIVPLAATRSADVAFTILVSAAAVTPEQQTLMVVEEEMKVQNTPASEMKAALEKVTAQIAELKSEETRIQMEQQLKQMKAENKDSLLSEKSLENPRYLLWFRSILEHDPIPVLNQVRCPVLVIHGNMDRIVPMEKNLDRLQIALKAGGNKNVSVRIFPKANHALMETTTGGVEDYFRSKRFVSGFLDSITKWIRQ